APPLGEAQAVPAVEPGRRVEPAPGRRQHALPAVQVARQDEAVARPRRGGEDVGGVGTEHARPRAGAGLLPPPVHTDRAPPRRPPPPPPPRPGPPAGPSGRQRPPGPSTAARTPARPARSSWLPGTAYTGATPARSRTHAPSSGRAARRSARSPPSRIRSGRQR